MPTGATTLRRGLNPRHLVLLCTVQWSRALRIGSFVLPPVTRRRVGRPVLMTAAANPDREEENNVDDIIDMLMSGETVGGSDSSSSSESGDDEDEEVRQLPNALER